MYIVFHISIIMHNTKIPIFSLQITLRKFKKDPASPFFIVYVSIKKINSSSELLDNLAFCNSVNSLNVHGNPETHEACVSAEVCGRISPSLFQP